MITNKTVLLVSPLNKIGGKANFTALLVSAFDKHNVEYYHIDLIRAKSQNRLIRLIEHFISFFYYKLLFMYLLVIKKIDVVQIHTSTKFDFWDLSLFIIISKTLRKKTYVRYGGAIFKEYYFSVSKMHRTYINWIFSLFDVFIVQSSYWRDYFIGIGVDADKLYILPNFVDDKLFQFKRSSDSIENISVLFMPATSLNRKGFFDLKKSISLLAEKHPLLRFHIVGPDVGKYISGSNIFTYEVIYGKKKIKLFEDCTIFLLPTHSEGFPNALLEALASGMAVITTNIPQISCLVENGEHCLLMSPGAADEFHDRIENLINNPKEKERLGANGRALIEEKYSINKMPDYLRSLYHG